ncbi:MAG: Hsp20/alpha crystallin family protein, partial [Bradymonadaceae bacterium]
MLTSFNNPREWFRNELRNFFRDAAGSGSSSWRGPSSRWTPQRSRTAGAFPPVNIYDDGEGFRIRAELPGVDKEDLEIHAQGDEITIRGERNIAPPEEGADWHRRERQGGKFRRTVTLPQTVNPDKVTANLELGVLDV